MGRKCILGIDTSNYKTSIAMVDVSGKIIIDERTLLKVKKGERGLRQSEALFQHIENLPILFETFNNTDLDIVAVAVSNKPRSVDGSYMPCFKAGYGFGKAIASSIQVPFFEFSHQEGHIEAIRHNTELSNADSILAWHLSGGTCELLKVYGQTIEIVGGSKDISFGQVIDRIGVLLGMSFPSGAEMDTCALMCLGLNTPQRLSKIKTDDMYFNLSGIETQCNRVITNGNDFEVNVLIKELFDKITMTISTVTKTAVDRFGISDVIFAGGVSCSEYISKAIRSKKKYFRAEFGNQALSSDNAVGIALLGLKKSKDLF